MTLRCENLDGHVGGAVVRSWTVSYYPLTGWHPLLSPNNTTKVQGLFVGDLGFYVPFPSAMHTPCLHTPWGDCFGLPLHPFPIFDGEAKVVTPRFCRFVVFVAETTILTLRRVTALPSVVGQSRRRFSISDSLFFSR